MSAHKRRAYDFLNVRSSASLAGALTTAVVLTIAAVAPAASDPAVHPGHVIADRFAADADRARAAEAARKETARKEAQRRRADEADKAAKAKAQKDWEAELLARAKTEAEERRRLEAEASRLDALRIAREAQEAAAAQKRTEAARQAENARLAEEGRKAEETQRAAEALRLAVERAAADDARKAAEARKLEEAKAQEAQRIEAARVAEEARRAQQARAEEDSRRAEAQRIEAARKAEQAAWAAEEARRTEAIRKANEDLRLAAERAATEQRAAQQRAAEDAQRAVTRATEEETRRVGALEADAEVKRVAERLRQIREEHLARHTGSPGRSLERSVEPSSGTLPVGRLGGPAIAASPKASAPGAASPQLVADLPMQRERDAYSHRHDGRVTVLLQMEPRMRRGRGHESMDPVLCLTDGCYVSNGPEAPASFLPGRKAMRFGNVIGRRAGVCNHAYTCVFRNVEIGALPAEIQPVDIRVLRHDRRQPESVDALSICRSTPGRLACTGAIQGDGYTMWIIPDSVAARLPIDLFGASIGDETARAPHAALGQPRGRW